MVKRIITYCFGLFCMALGVSFSIKSNLGVSPVNSIPYVLSLALEVNQGLITTIIFTIYVGIQIVILRKDFKIKNLFQIVFASIFGYFVSFSNFLLQGLASPSNYIMKLLFLCISIVIVAIGLFFYLSADILPQPPEGIMLAICQKIEIQFHKIKMIFDSTVVIIAIVISFIAFGELVGIREGTILSALLIGKVLGIINKRFKKPFQIFLFKEKNNLKLQEELE